MAFIDPIVAGVTVISVAGIASKTVDTILRHRRKLREPSRVLAERLADGQLDEMDYLRTLALIGGTDRQPEYGAALQAPTRTGVTTGEGVTGWPRPS